MRDGFALFDNRGRLVVWNPQYPLLLGLTAEALQRGQHYQSLLQQVSDLPGHVQENLAQPPARRAGSPAAGWPHPGAAF